MFVAKSGELSWVRRVQTINLWQPQTVPSLPAAHPHLPAMLKAVKCLASTPAFSHFVVEPTQWGTEMFNGLYLCDLNSLSFPDLTQGRYLTQTCLVFSSSLGRLRPALPSPRAIQRKPFGRFVFHTSLNPKTKCSTVVQTWTKLTCIPA